ncbi:MAG: hypothetical protein M1839_003420 [Geoglossum umbratile]|nr:MAG: hypothetical protein M1839_003420 [Geoglossum umbratile]
MAQQPDFGLIAQKFTDVGQAHGTISEQLLLCTNLPAVADGVAILTQLTILSDAVTALVGQVTTLNDRMTTVENAVTALSGRVAAVEDRMTTVENAVTALSGRVAAVEVCVAELGPRLQADQINSLARGHNGKLPGADHALEPLVDIKTCVPIPHFPFNAAEVSGMTSANLSTVLTALGAPPIHRETADNKKGRLLKFIGMFDIRR